MALTLAEYATAKRLPVDFLESLGLSDTMVQGAAAVRIPYWNETGDVELCVNRRLALTGDGRFRMRSGDKKHLYGLNRLTTDEYVVLVEGESDCHALWYHGFNTLGVPGASSWNEERDTPHVSRYDTIFVVQEPDAGGDKLITSLQVSQLRSRIRVVQLEAGDADALHQEDPEAFPAEMGAALSVTEVLEGLDLEAELRFFFDPSHPSNETLKIVKLAQARYRLGVSSDKTVFAVRRNGPNLAIPLRYASGLLRAELAAEFYDYCGEVPSTSSLSNAMLVLEGLALREDPTVLHTRVAGDTDTIWIDRGDVTGEAIRVTGDGWRLVESAPVIFRRSEVTGILPRPERGGDPSELQLFLNVTSDVLPLIIGWLVAAFIPSIPHPILALRGLQGSGKSEALRLLVSLFDPSPAPLRSPPSDQVDWVVAAAGSWGVALDNMSKFPYWLQDALCRAVTDDALLRRRLYTDQQISLIQFRRVIAFNGIDFGEIRGDLADRTVFIEQPSIEPEERRTDRDIESSFRASQPRILGGLLDLLAAVLKRLPDVHLATLPRMADFARILAAMDAELGTNALHLFQLSQANQLVEVAESDQVASAVLEFMKHRDDSWIGTATELHTRLTDPDRPPRDWPATPSHLSGRLSRAVPALEALGIEVERLKSLGPERTRLIRLTNRKRGRPERPDSDSPDGAHGEIPTSSVEPEADE